MPPDIFERAADKAGAAEDLLRDASRFKSMIADAVDDGFQTAIKTINQGREAAGDMINDARKVIRRNPQAIGLAFVAGVVVGGLVFWTSRR